jgi:photosystem II stability/assembly factor-like uncharacterized protein
LKPSHFFRGAIGALLLVCGPMAGAGVNSFTLTGPEGASVWAIAAQPGHPEVVLASTSRGMYRSTNGGTNWTLTGSQGAGEYIAFDPSFPDRVYTLGSQLYRSVDAGLTFTHVSIPGAPQYLDYLAVSEGRVYVASNRGSLFRSDDGGVNWTALTVPWPASSPTQVIIALAAAPTDDNIVYACAMNLGTYKTIDGGANWTGPAAGSPCSAQFNYAWSLAVSPVDANRVVAATSEGIYLSTTGNASWSVPSLIRPEWIYFDPAAPDHVVAVGQIGSIAHSPDGGANWPTVTPWQNILHARMSGGAFSGVAGHFYVAAYAGPLFSSDNLNSFSLRAGGMHAATVRDLVAADDGTIYAMQTAGSPGIWRRTPGSWVPADNDELRTIANNELRLNAIATAAEQSSLVYVIQADQVMRSINSGVDWIDQPASITHQPITVTVDPTNPQVAYVSAYNSASNGLVMRTDNGGVSFSACGGSAPPLKFMLVDRASPNIIYGIGSYAPWVRLYKSTNSCQSWTAMTGEIPYLLNDVAIDPADHEKIYLVKLDGVQRSLNGGATWTPINFGDPHGESLVAGSVLIDPVIPSTIWVTTLSASGFARSVDDGATWQHVRIPGPGFFPVYSGVLDPLMPDTLVAGADSWGLVEYQVAPDLEVSLDMPPNPLPTGASDTATVSVNNLGPFDSSVAEIMVTLPSSINATTVPSGCTLNSSTVRCRAASLRVGQQASFALGLTPTAVVTAAPLTATVSGHETDPNSTNDTAARNITALAPIDLRLGVTGGGIVVDHGSTTRFTITSSNQGGVSASNATLQLNLTGFASPIVTISRGSCAIAVTSTVCAIGTLAPGETVTATLDVNAAALGSNTLEVRLRELPAGPEIMQTLIMSARAVGDASVEVTDSADPVLRDAGYQYTATVRNVSGDSAPIDFSAALTGATAGTVTTSGGTCTSTASTVTCALTALAAGASTTVTINATSATAGNASLTATVNYSGTDSVAANNTATASTTINAPAPPPPSGGGGGGGGGGGRLDWLLAALLGVLLARRQLRLLAPAHPVRRQQART